MSDNQTEKTNHKDGPSWKVARTFASFKEADVFRQTCLTDETKQAKVRRQVKPTGEEVFVVKVRSVPTLENTEKKKQKNKK